MTDQLKIRISEDVPCDEAWFVERLPWDCYVVPTGIRIVERLKVVGKIINLSLRSTSDSSHT